MTQGGCRRGRSARRLFGKYSRTEPFRHEPPFGFAKRYTTGVPQDQIVVRGARETTSRSLRTFPRDRPRVITRASVAANRARLRTIYAEGQRRLVESLSA